MTNEEIKAKRTKLRDDMKWLKSRIDMNMSTELKLLSKTITGKLTRGQSRRLKQLQGERAMMEMYQKRIFFYLLSLPDTKVEIPRVHV